ncbi:putative bifunctional diguanylate cyclase/phosphodiesterase [Smaragdicoccus niigatensis]|uniref:putative bifunctional diguanylate cyclase/phosphodiesterase n=1 Tax=Smaragdicoccus niigatensis TaxID=359359 RepID=UPI00037B873B|nr:bifunctional diguanylate cyclase/phosphodiesterase [Smaragdicoccus niigatensis]
MTEPHVEAARDRSERASRHLAFAARGATALAQSNWMSIVTGGFYMLGGLLGDLVTYFMPGESGSKPLIYAIATTAFFVGVWLVVAGRRLRPVDHQYLIGAATVLVTIAVTAAPNNIGAMAIASMYVLASSDAAFFFPARRAMFFVAFSMVNEVLALALRDDLPWWSGLLGAGMATGVGIVTAVLARLASNADIDALTGLLNRRGLDQLLEVEIAKASRSGTRLALVLFDIDDFKHVNDEQGHRAGDAVLVEVADVWGKIIAGEGVLARYGGDEFALLLADTTEDRAITLAETLRRAAPIRSSAGATSWQAGESGSLLVSRADVALYRAKLSGRNRTMLESSDLPAIAKELRDTLAMTKVHYQPIVRLDQPDNPIFGIEALIRWRSKLKPDLNPQQVIEIAEANDLVFDLDITVLGIACRDAVMLQDRSGAQGLTLHVNMSGLTLNKPMFLMEVRRVLAETGWPAQQLVLEVTETVLDGDKRYAMAKLEQMREEGIRVAIDDFGTGYSSLSRLQSLPVDELKLDRTFVSAISSHGTALLEAVATLGRALNLAMIAEGVEDAEQAALLASLGYPLAQGYYFARPMPIEQLLERLTTTNAQYRRVL